MEGRCRYCHGEVPFEALVCPQCGTRLVDVEERRRLWPYAAALLGLIALGVGVYLFFAWTSEVANTPAPQVKAKKDSTPDEFALEEERNRQAILEMNRQWKEEQELAATASKEQKAWNALTPQQQTVFVTEQLAGLKMQVDKLKTSSDPKTLEAAANLEAQWENAGAFVKAGSLDVAFESFRALRERVQELEKPKSPSPPETGAQVP